MKEKDGPLPPKKLQKFVFAWLIIISFELYNEAFCWNKLNCMPYDLKVKILEYLKIWDLITKDQFRRFKAY